MSKTENSKEYCEECGKEITKGMKESQVVIYSNAEHTLDAEGLMDDMWGGVFCSSDCLKEHLGYYSQVQHNLLIKVERIIDEWLDIKGVDGCLRELLTQNRLDELKAKLKQLGK